MMKMPVKNPGLSELDELCIQTIRFLSIDAIQKANSGHPGMPMGMAPADFTERILRQIDSAENKRILARVVMEERLALAGCIVLGVMVIVAVTVFPSVAVSFKELVGTFIDKVTQTI